MNDPSLIPPASAQNYLVTSPVDRDTVRIQADKLSFGGHNFKDVDLTLNLEKPGLLGLDAGGSAVSTWYYPHLLTDAKGTRLSGVLSTSAVQSGVAMPDGFTVAFRGGSVYNNAAGDLFRFAYVNGWWWYMENIAAVPFRVVNGVAAAAAWSAAVTAMAPPGTTQVWMVGRHVNALVKGIATRPDGLGLSNAWLGYSATGGALDDVFMNGPVFLHANGNFNWFGGSGVGFIYMDCEGYYDPLFS